eukprot:83917-Rhodomonas_salina.1
MWVLVFDFGVYLSEPCSPTAKPSSRLVCTPTSLPVPCLSTANLNLRYLSMRTYAIYVLRTCAISVPHCVRLHYLSTAHRSTCPCPYAISLPRIA